MLCKLVGVSLDYLQEIKAKNGTISVSLSFHYSHFLIEKELFA